MKPGVLEYVSTTSAGANISEFDKDPTATELIGRGGGTKYLINQCNKCLKVIYTSADSLSNKMDELKLLVKPGMCDMVAITEALP